MMTARESILAELAVVQYRRGAVRHRIGNLRAEGAKLAGRELALAKRLKEVDVDNGG